MSRKGNGLLTSAMTSAATELGAGRADGDDRNPKASPDTPAKTALLYLRVSSAAQADTDYDREGLSLPAQRDACTRKATSLGAKVVDEFVERGESGRSTVRRSALASMLVRLDARDIDYVVVHKVDRLARKRADDSTILAAFQASGATLVSVSENIDETPSGMLLHGIMASIAEFYSMNLAAEVLKGTTEKAKRGGTPYRAPLGYRNVRELVEGREVRTIALDPERAPLIREAFQLYATSDYALSDLAAIMEMRGLRTPATASYPARVVESKRLSTVLRNPVYVGQVRYRGKVYKGRHDRLIDDHTFEQVQTVLSGRRTAGERASRWQHYLRGTVICNDCGGRLIYTRANGNGGTYEYFVCRGKQRGECIQPHYRVEAVEAAIEEHYAIVMLSPARRERIAAAVRDFCSVRQQATAHRSWPQPRRNSPGSRARSASCSTRTTKTACPRSYSLRKSSASAASASPPKRPSPGSKSTTSNCSPPSTKPWP